MDIYGNSSIAKDIPLLVSSHMASKEILQNLNVPYLDIYSANVWDEARQNKENELLNVIIDWDKLQSRLEHQIV